MMHLVPASLALFALAAPSVHAAPLTEGYYALTLQGHRVGYGHYNTTTLPNGTVKVLSDVLIKVGMLGSPLDMRYQAITEYAADGVTPKTFALTLTRGTNPTTITCRFHGKTADWAQTTNGQTTHRTLALSPGTALVEGNLVETWRNALRQAPRNGKAFTVSALEPMAGAVSPVTFTPRPAQTVIVGGKPVKCAIWAVGKDAEALTFTVAPNGTIVGFDVPGQKANFLLANKEALKDIASFDLTSQAFATVTLPVSNANALQSIRLQVNAHIVGGTVTVASLQRPPAQTFQGTVKNGFANGVFTIKSNRYDGTVSPKFPYAPSVVATQKQWLKPDNLTESDDPQIKALAHKLTAGSKNGWEAASKIARWVFENITYKITGASAKTCLATKEGDCGPHTNLTIALCRAAGIPARMTGGALYTGLLGGSYGQHYWVRVWMGNKSGWVAVDPTAGEIGDFHPTHLTLWDTASLGSLTVKVLDYAPKTAAFTEVSQTRRANGLVVGYAEKYVFAIGGKEIGTQAATLTGIADGQQTWNYALRLTTPRGDVSETGTAALSDTGQPRQFHMDLSASGIQQSLSLAFGANTAKATIGLGSAAIARDVPTTGNEFIGGGNLLSFWSLALRSLPAPSDAPAHFTLMMAESLQPLTITLTPAGTDTLTLGAQTIACHKYQASPLGETFWLDSQTGALVKLEDTRQKLVVTRQ